MQPNLETHKDHMGALIFGLLMSVLTLTIPAFGGSFFSSEAALRAAKTHGFGNATVTSHHWFFVGFQGCGTGDLAKFVIRAKNALEEEVHFYACRGLFKGTTIRTD